MRNGPAAGDGERLLSLRVPARPAELRRVRDEVRRCADGAGAGPECSRDVVMAVDEACQNIIRHAYRGEPGGTIEIEVERRGDALVILLRDDAPAIDPSTVRPRPLDDVRPGGLGTHLIRQVMDEAGFVPQRGERGNLLRMVKRIR